MWLRTHTRPKRQRLSGGCACVCACARSASHPNVHYVRPKSALVTDPPPPHARTLPRAAERARTRALLAIISRAAHMFGPEHLQQCDCEWLSCAHCADRSPPLLPVGRPTQQCAIVNGAVRLLRERSIRRALSAAQRSRRGDGSTCSLDRPSLQS